MVMQYFDKIFHFTWVDAIDILLVSLLLYQLFIFFRETSTIKIFIGIALLYILWKVVAFLGLSMLGDILGNFINLGVLLLIIVFQPEIRKFLLYMGSRTFISSSRGRFLFWRFNKPSSLMSLNIDEIVDACVNMSMNRTGALIVIGRQSTLADVILSGYMMEAEVKSLLLQNIFYKNTPLHDGAVIIKNNRIVAAKCVLPLASSTKLGEEFGTRHRAAVGITETTDAVAIVVSEQSGKISLAVQGQLNAGLKPSLLKDLLHLYFS
jgi:uncharacterized protein (TIGR00159 family)